MKKLLSLILALAMILTLAVPAMAAEGDRTIYFENTGDWDTVNAFYWNAQDYSLTWPGVAMTNVEGSIWSVQVPAATEFIVFNDGSGAQTGDQTIPTSDNVLFSIGAVGNDGYYTGSWNAYGSVDGNGSTESEVNATYIPEIEVTGISAEGETVSYNEETDTYTVFFPVGAESVDFNVIFSGKNLAFYRDAHQVMWREKIYFADSETLDQYMLCEYNYFTYNPETGDLETSCNLTPASAGMTVVYEYTNDTGSTWEYACTQVFKQLYSIAVDPEIANGTVTADKEFAAEGETVTLTVAPTEGYELDTLTVTDAEGNAVAVESNAFTMPASNVTVEATFAEAKETYTVTLPETFENGAVTVEGGKTSFTENETVTLNITSAEGYELDKLTVNGEDVTADVVDGKYSFPMGSADVEVTATFKKMTYAIEIGTFEGGTVTADVETAAEGDTVTLTITTTGKYQLKSIAVWDAENEPVEFTETGLTVYKFVMPASEVTVEAVFEEVLTTSADIVWGSLSFVYTDSENGAEDGAWSCEEGANKITVTNTGDKDFSAHPYYNAEPEYTEIVGRFYDSMDAEENYTMGYRLCSGDIVEIYLKLHNQPSKAIPEGTKIGSVTIEITEGFGE